MVNLIYIIIIHVRFVSVDDMCHNDASVVKSILITCHTGLYNYYY